MFTGPYGVAEDGSYSEWIAVRDEDLCIIPDTIDDATAGGMPVAYLTAQITLTQAGFEPGKTVLAPAIGGAVGNGPDTFVDNEKENGHEPGTNEQRS